MNSFQAHITVATIVERDGRFLFVHERVGSGQAVLNQPAGHVEAGETLMQAAFRETLEETAWQVRIDSLIGVYIFQPNQHAGVYYRFCFAASALSHDAKQTLDDGILQACWLSPEELAQRQTEHRSALVQQCLNDYLAGKRLPLDSLYHHPWPLQRG